MVDTFKAMWQCMGNGRGKPNAETKINTMNQIKINLIATLPDGNIATRKTHRAYTAVVAVQHIDGTWYGWSWHGSQKLAKTKANWLRDRRAEGSADFQNFTETTVVAVVS